MNNNDTNKNSSGFSESELIRIEKNILSVIKSPYKIWFVKINTTFSKDQQIWTIALNEKSKNVPLVLLHGFAAGLGVWCFNFDHLSKDRPVYAVDLLGFGRSSRPNFSNDPLVAEKQMIEAIEEWRKQLKIESFILLGHSFGAYLASNYVITYPEPVKYLILADPWGFTIRPAKMKDFFWIKLLEAIFYPFTVLNPLATMRAAGPYGLWLIRKFRNVAAMFETISENKDFFTEYMFHCNSQSPTGETAFQSMKMGFAWAKNPMLLRFHEIRSDIPVTVVYGENTWLRKMNERVLNEKRPNSFNEIKFVPSAGHQLNVDQAKLFNETIENICGRIN